MDFEDVLKQVGDFGKFQKLLVYLFLVPVSALNVIYEYLFMLTTPDHWCHVPELAHLPIELQKKLIQPITIEQGVPSLDKCMMYDIDYGQIANTSALPFNDTSVIKTKQCENGWTYDRSVFEATATSEFDLVCDNAHYVSFLLSLGAIALVIFTPFLSVLTDWLGRKRSFLIINIIYAITFISPLILRDYTSFAISRFLSSSLMVVYYQVPFIMVMEFVGVDYRSRTSSLSAIGYSLGGCVVPLIAYLTGHWVRLAVVQMITLIPVFIFWRFLPESASWLITQKRYEEAHQVLQRVAKINGKDVKDLMLSIQIVGSKQEEEKKSKKNDSAWDLIRVPQLRKQLFILILLFVANVLAYGGLALNSLNFHGNEFLNYFLLSLADIPAMTLGWYLIEGPLGRRWTNTLSLMLCGITLCVPSVLDPSHKTWITVLSLLGKGGTATSYMIIFQQSAEIFPTTLRSEGLGVCCTIGSFVGIFTPYVSFLGRYGLWIPMFVMGFGCLVAAIASSFLPETLNENLPQNSAESAKFGKNRSFFSLANTKETTHL